jgi:signal transduction histidine kinase
MSSNSVILLTAVYSVTIVLLGLFLFFVLMMIRSHRKINITQQERIHQMQVFSDKLQTAREDEQKNIARELHDELGGALTSIKYDLLWLEKHSTMKGVAKKRYQAIRNLVDTTTKTVQRISSELRPKILDGVGLIAAVEWHTREFSKRTGIEVKLNLKGELPVTEDKTAIGVYRIIQEALTNVARHSEATCVEVEIIVQDGEIHAEVLDNGKGIDVALLSRPASIGILGMQERARMLGGKITITNNNGKGTRITLSAPVDGRNQLFKGDSI